MQHIRAMHGNSGQLSKATSFVHQSALPRLRGTWPLRTLSRRSCIGDSNNPVGVAQQQQPQSDAAPHNDVIHRRRSSRKSNKRVQQHSRVNDAVDVQKAGEPLQQPGGQSWQQQWQKQKQRQRYQHPRRQQQQHPKGTRSPAAYPHGSIGNHGSGREANVYNKFSGCTSFASMQTILQQLENQLAQQPQQDVEGGGVSLQLHAEQRQQQQQQQHCADLLLTTNDTLLFMEQLSAISESSSHNSSSMTESFLEGQALQQLLPLAYKLLAEHAAAVQAAATSSLPTGLLPAAAPPPPPAAAAVAAAAGTSVVSMDPTAAAQGSGAAAAQANTISSPMKPWQLLQCVSCLAQLKYCQPEQLAAVLDQVTAARPGLLTLNVQHLAALTANLARAGVRPSNAWLVALMQATQAKLTAADLQQLSQILSGLVRMGVKPAAAWMNSLEDQAVQCLIEQAVRHHVVVETSQQQQQQDGERRTAAEPENFAAGGAADDAGGQLQAVAALLTAIAEAKHVPQPQLAAALWGATGPTLIAAGTASLVDVMTALGELQLVPPGSWMQQYFSSTVGRLEQYRPWQLAVSVAAIGNLTAAGLTGCRQQQQQQQQQHHTAGAGVDCAGWVQAVLSVVEKRLRDFSARDLAALLGGLAALQLQLPAPQLQLLLAEAKEKLPRFNPAGLAGITQAVVQLEQQHQQYCGGRSSSGSLLLSEAWMGALLREAAQKLPVFAAHDLCGLLVAVQGSGFRPSSLWVEAAAAQLQSKLTVLEPGQVVSVVRAVMDLGHLPQQQWVMTALAALDGKLIELDALQMEVLLQRLVVLRARPSSMWLETATWALQQQQQQAEVVSVAENEEPLHIQGSSVCQHLLQQLKQNVAENRQPVEAACSIQA